MQKSILLSLFLSAGSVVADPVEPRPAPPAFEKGEEQAPDLIDDAPRQILVTVEFIEVQQEDATRLLYKEKLGKDGEKLREVLQEMLDAGKGKMIETVCMNARGGHRANAESLREVIYPTEYEQGAVLEALPHKPENETGNRSEGVAPGYVAAPPLATAFATRGAGSSLEIEPNLGDDSRTVDLRFESSLVFHTGRSLYQQRKDSQGNETTVEMPLFYSMKTSTSLTLSDGQSQLTALLSPKGADGTTDPSRKVFVIVRAEVVVAKAGKPKQP